MIAAGFRDPVLDVEHFTLRYTVAADLMRELDETRQRGYGLAREEAEVGVGAVAVSPEIGGDHVEVPPQAASDGVQLRAWSRPPWTRSRSGAPALPQSAKWRRSRCER